MIRPAFSTTGLVLCLLLLSAARPAISPAETKTGSPSAPAPANAPPVSAKPTDAPSASPSPANPQRAALDQVLTVSASKVIDRIQDEEAELYQKLSYFQKPDRLDPNSYASVEEVQSWQKLLQDLRDKGARVAGLYADAGKHLDAELSTANVNVQLTQRFRQMVLDGFPWDIIRKKDQLFRDYVNAHGKLLAFYEKNWGTWEPGQPLKFKTVQLSKTYEKIKEEVVSTGKQLDQQYKAMAE